MTSPEEKQREDSLRDAQSKALDFFQQISEDLLEPGITEKALSDKIHALGSEKHNVRTHWHKRVVRSGPNTLHPYAENPPDRVIEKDDILFVDLGPVFEAWEADFGRTYVLGDDPAKCKIRDLLEPLWNECKTEFDKDPDMTGEKLYAIVCEAATRNGYEYGAVHSGHLIGEFPHERIPNDQVSFYITKGNNEPMRKKDKNGHMRHWILEMHLVDRERQIGGFFEQLLTVNC